MPENIFQYTIGKCFYCCKNNKSKNSAVKIVLSYFLISQTSMRSANIKNKNITVGVEMQFYQILYKSLTGNLF
jgi:hypothetical protein